MEGTPAAAPAVAAPAAAAPAAAPAPTQWNFRIPRKLDVWVDVPWSFARVQRQYLTCFRCGQGHHYKSECGQFRTKLCTAWLRNECSETYCPFAHGEKEMRRPWIPVCVRVTKVNGKIIRLGCGQTGHVYRACPDRAREESNAPAMRSPSVCGDCEAPAAIPAMAIT